LHDAAKRFDEGKVRFGRAGKMGGQVYGNAGIGEDVVEWK
jgi:hypothetical protein